MSNVKPYEMRRVTITGYDRVNLYLDGEKVGTITATPSTVWNGRPKDDPSVVTLNGKRWEFDTETAAIEFARAQLQALTAPADEQNAEIMESEGSKSLKGIAAAVDSMRAALDLLDSGARQARTRAADILRAALENHSTKC